MASFPAREEDWTQMWGHKFICVVVWMCVLYFYGYICSVSHSNGFSESLFSSDPGDSSVTPPSRNSLIELTLPFLAKVDLSLSRMFDCPFWVLGFTSASKQFHLPHPEPITPPPAKMIASLSRNIDPYSPDWSFAILLPWPLMLDMATQTVWFAVNYTEAFTRGRAAKPRRAKARPKSITQSTEVSPRTAGSSSLIQQWAGRSRTLSNPDCFSSSTV